MRIPFISFFNASPFEGVQEHAEKIKECTWTFQQALECYTSTKCITFEEHRQEIIRFVNEAEAIKRRVLGHIPKWAMLPVNKFQLFSYLKEQDKVLDSIEDAIDWISYRSDSGVPDHLEKEFFLLFDSVIDPIEELSNMVVESRKYFKRFSGKQRNVVKTIITNIQKMEHDADKIEDKLKRKIFETVKDQATLFHLVRLTEIIGNIADHADNAGDMMRAMIQR